jgi:Tfp pilus assembly protein PilV
MKRNIKKGGFMMVEILVAVSIATASILTATAVAQKSIYVSRLAFHTTQAAFLLEEGAEAVRIIRDNAWSNISALTPGATYYLSFSDLSSTWILSNTANTVGIFTRTVSFANVNRDNLTKDIGSTGTNDPDTKLVTITVSWSEGGVTVTKNLQFYIMNIF